MSKLRPESEDAEGLKQLEKLAEEVLDDYPLKPHELLRDSTFRKKSGIRDKLARLGERHGNLLVWIREQDGSVSAMLLRTATEIPLAGRTVLLPPEAGGLSITDGRSTGLLDEDAEFQPEYRNLYDVADEWYEDESRTVRRRIRVLDDSPDLAEKTSKMRLVRTVELREAVGDDDAETKKWAYYVRPKSADDDGSKTSLEASTWKQHTADVVREATRCAGAS